MKTPALFLLSGMFLFLAHTAAVACSLNPTAQIVTDPSGSTFFHGEPVVFDGTTSTANCGSINQYRWRVRPVGGTYTTVSWSSVYSHTFTLEPHEGEKDYQVELRVRNTAGKYGFKTITVTVKRHYTRQYYLTDHLGSVRVTVNEQGDPVGWDDYYPFGLQMPGRTQNASNPNDDVKFTGHLLNQDGDLGFYYMIFRNYDPVIGRFMSPDPMQEYGSAYVYVGNNPIRWIDEFGLMSNDTLRVLPSGAADGGELPEIEVTAQGNRNATIHRISALERFLFRLDNLGRTENMFGDFVVHARNGHFRVNANQLNVSFGIPGDGLPIGPGGPLKIGTIWRTSKVMNANQLYHAVRPSHNLISVGLNSEKAKLFVNDTLTRLANTNKLKDGANTIITNVNGKTVTIRAYFRGNELQSWNIFAGQSSRTVGNIINESVK